MRVIAGQARGCKLEAPLGQATRPTPERAREALFSMWLSMGPLGAGLDVFAGSGAIGIEALSRGAPQVVFIERAPAALSVLRRNIAKLPAPLPQRGHIVAAPYPAALSAAGQGRDAFDWIFVDPPFAGAPYAEVLAALANERLSHADTRVVLEHDSTLAAPQHPFWQRQRSRRFGAVTLSFYVWA